MADDGDTSEQLVNDSMARIAGSWMWTGTRWETVEQIIRKRIADNILALSPVLGERDEFCLLVCSAQVRQGREWQSNPYPRRDSPPAIP